MRIYLLSALVFLTACTPRQEVTQRFDDWTGFAETITPEYEILRDSRAIMTVRGIMLARDGQRGFAVLTRIRRLGPNGPLVLEMRSGDIRLDYRRHDRLLTQCRDRCRRSETGAILMSETAFRQAATTGLPLRISGRRQRYEATVPARLFQAILNGL